MRLNVRLRLAIGALTGATLIATAAAPQWRPAQIWEKTLAPGLTYRQEVDPNLPRTLNALRISPQSPTLRWSSELAGKTINEEGTVKGRLTPTLMAAQSGAIAAVNADFFSFDHGAPLGLMVRNGELVTTAARPRAVFGWGPKDAGTGLARSTATLNLGGGSTLPIDAVNQPVGTNGLAFYTPTVGTVLSAKPNLTLVFKIPDAPISPETSVTATLDYALPDAQRTEVPAGRALLVATGTQMANIAGIRPGDSVTIRVKTEGFDWERYENVVGGGPLLLKGGEPAIDAAEEGFNESFLVRHPRTAIGKTAQGDVWIVTVDGRQTSSVGATLDDMARIMKRLGCTDAINLDGGGSTALNILGLTVNRPSDGVERPVANGILVFGPKPKLLGSKLKLVLGAKLADGTVQASVELDGKPVPQSDVLWSARGAAWIDQGGLIHPIHAGKSKILARAYGEPLDGEMTIEGTPPADPKKVPAADRGL
jgi:hypothetical protein